AVLACSPVAARLIRGLPRAPLVGFHAFRLPLELMMHRAAAEGVMPVQMSYSGRNFDIVTGITALGMAWALRRRVSWGLVFAWNALGTLLLVTVVGIAVGSLPLFHAFGTAPAQLNTWVTHAPFAWLPLILVPAALLGHLLIWRWLFSPAYRQSSVTAP
ncbi:MAG: hypothetical protein H7338_22220, partial [Candidatus Sericytochromatia bacterium]|nr:hypothetical protein [Candidatus Sericytochromatia bacterium]